MFKRRRAAWLGFAKPFENVVFQSESPSSSFPTCPCAGVHENLHASHLSFVHLPFSPLGTSIPLETCIGVSNLDRQPVDIKGGKEGLLYVRSEDLTRVALA